MTVTRVRTIQYVGILLSLGLIAAGYWYFSVRAGVNTNTGAMQPQGIGDLSAGLAGYWKLDENTGTSAGDASTNGNTGTLTNGPTWTTGQIGSGVDFDGSNDYITAPDNSALDFTDGATFTVTGWFNRDTFTTDDTIVAKSNGPLAAGYEVFIDDATDYLSFYVGDGTDYYGYVTSSNAFTSSGWHHFSAVWGDTYMKIYVDGVDVGVYNEGTIGNINSLATALTLNIGTESDGQVPFDGKIDEIRVYDRVLSSDEIANLYRLTTPTGVDTSLKGYWSFNSDALSGTTAYDRSGAGNTGTLTNGPAATEGRIGQGLDFDGSDDQVNAGSATTLDDMNLVTMCAWAKPDAIGVDPRIYAKADANGQNGIGINLTETTNRFEFRHGWTGAAGARWDTSDNSVVIGTWQHLCATYDGSSTANDPTLYINGVSVPITEVSAPSGTLSSDASYDAIIGNRPDGARPFEGGIDELRIYSRILSATEIKSLYDRGTPDKSNTSAAQPVGTGNLNSGLTGYWKLDEGTGTSASDSGTNAITALTLTNGPTWTTGQIGSAVDFDGTNDYATTPDNALLEFSDTEDFTISGWFNRDTATTDDSIAFKRNGVFSTNSGYSVYIDDATDQLIFGVSDNTDPYSVTSTTTFTSSGWHHFVAVWDQDSASGTTLYIDGVAEGTDSGTIGNVGAIDGTQPFIIGAESDGDNPFDGKLDEIRLYDRILSTTEAANLYRLTTPTGVDTSLKGYWSFNGQDTTSTIAYDRSGVGNDGTLTGGPPVVEGRVGQALSFDNVNDYVLAGSPAAVDDLETQGGGGLTASAWIYPESGGTFGGVIVGKRAAPSPGGGDWALTMHQDGDAIKFFKSYSTTSLEATTLPGSIVLNKWQYVTATWSGTAARSSVTFYIDGVLVPTSTSGGSDGVGTKDSDASNVVSISSQFVQYDGLIDEVRLHNRILSAAEVKTLYDIGAPDKTNTSVSTPQGTGRLDSGLAGYWKLDENTGTSASDASANGNTGTLTNSPTWSTGRIGSAVQFDGTNDYIGVATTTAITGLSRFTVCAWVNPTDNASPFPAVFNTYDASLTDGWDIYLVNGFSGGHGIGTSYRGSGGATYIQRDAAVVTFSQWSHVCAQQDGDSQSNMRLFVNGAPVLIDSSASFSGRISDVGNPISIGRYADSTDYYSGQIDEIRVYNYLLSDQSIGNLYSLGAPTGTDTGLKGYWSFNGQDLSGTTASDRSGAGNTGTLTNGPTVTEGKIGQALSFDGTDDYINLGDPTSLEPASDITITAWVYLTAAGGYPGIVVKTTAFGEAFARYALYLDASTRVLKWARGGGVQLSGLTVPLNQWSFVAVSQNGSVLKMYLNGTEETYTSLSAPSYTTHETYIGSWTGSNGMFPGKIDEVRLYNRGLSASEIQALYMSGK